MTERWTAERVKEAVEKDQERLFAPYAVVRASNWACNPRTKDLVCIGYFLTEELGRICANEDDRRTQQQYYNRWSRSREDLFELGAETLNTVLDGQVEQGRIPHRRWG